MGTPEHRPASPGQRHYHLPYHAYPYSTTTLLRLSISIHSLCLDRRRLMRCAGHFLPFPSFSSSLVILVESLLDSCNTLPRTVIVEQYLRLFINF